MSELRNIIDMRRYYAKTVFGFAVAKTNLPVSRLPDAAEFKSFEALEIQHEQLDAMSVFRREALLERFPVVHGGNLMDKSLSRNIISAPVKIQDDFVAESARLLKMIAAQYRLHTVALDLSAGSAIADPVQKEALRRILRRL